MNLSHLLLLPPCFYHTPLPPQSLFPSLPSLGIYFFVYDFIIPEFQLLFDATSRPFEIRNFTVAILDDSIIEPLELVMLQFDSSDSDQVSLMTDQITIFIEDNDGKSPFLMLYIIWYRCKKGNFSLEADEYPKRLGN